MAAADKSKPEMSEATPADLLASSALPAPQTPSEPQQTPPSAPVVSEPQTAEV